MNKVKTKRVKREIKLKDLYGFLIKTSSFIKEKRDESQFFFKKALQAPFSREGR